MNGPAKGDFSDGWKEEGRKEWSVRSIWRFGRHILSVSGYIIITSAPDGELSVFSNLQDFRQGQANTNSTSLEPLKS